MTGFTLHRKTAMRRFDHAIPATPRQMRIFLIVITVLIIAVFAGMPRLTNLIEPVPEPVVEVIVPTPEPVVLAEVVGTPHTYRTSDLHNVRVAFSLKNTGTELGFYNVTLETPTTHAIVTVSHVPPGGVGYGDGYVTDKLHDRFIKDKLPDPPIVVVKIQQF